MPPRWRVNIEGELVDRGYLNCFTLKMKALRPNETPVSAYPTVLNCFQYLISLCYFNSAVLLCILCRSQWPRGLRRRSAAAGLLSLWVRIPPEAWIVVCCECCVLSGRGLCDGLITRPEESYRVWCVAVCDLETSWMRRPWPTGTVAPKTKKPHYTFPFMLQWLCLMTAETCSSDEWVVFKMSCFLW